MGIKLMPLQGWDAAQKWSTYLTCARPWVSSPAHRGREGGRETRRKEGKSTFTSEICWRIKQINICKAFIMVPGTKEVIIVVILKRSYNVTVLHINSFIISCFF
jgi:hypothetical protein